MRVFSCAPADFRAPSAPVAANDVFALSLVEPSAGKPTAVTALVYVICCLEQAVAKTFVAQQRQGDSGAVPFRLGFHAVPSMRQLHLHVMSQVTVNCCSKLNSICQHSLNYLQAWRRCATSTHQSADTSLGLVALSAGLSKQEHPQLADLTWRRRDAECATSATGLQCSGVEA